MDKITHVLAGIPLTGLALGGMSVEMTMLVLSIVLGFVSIFLSSRAVTNERGIQWNTGARDNTAPLQNKVAGRLQRAYRNFLETFPFFAVAVILITILDRHNARTVWGSQLYFWGRVIYLPLYWAGVPALRTLIWIVSIVGMFMVLSATIWP